MRTKKQKVQTLIKGIFFWVLSLVVIVPFLIVVFNAFKTQPEAINMELSLPDVWHFENFATVWEDGNILQSMKNSLILSVSSVAVTVVCSSMCAYVISRNRTKFNRLIYVFFAMGLMVPVSNVTIVKVLRVLNIYNTLFGTILVFIALLKPATVTVIMINFLNVWNDFQIPLYTLPDPSNAVIVQKVYNFFGTYTASWNLVSVTIIYAILPILVVYLFGQKYIISGMTAGSVKG